MSVKLEGHAVAPGVAIGRVHLAESNELEIGEFRIGREDVGKEVRRYRNAVEAARKQLLELADRIGPAVAAPAADIIQSHVLMLADSKIGKNTEEHIRNELCNAEWALQSQLEQILSEFRSMDDEYIRTRGEDVTQVVRLIQSKLGEEAASQPFENIPDRLADTLVVASELTPGELAILHERGVAGIVTEHGGPNSHTAILASSLGIPAVLGVRGARSLLEEDSTLILDGGRGLLIADPGQKTLQRYHELRLESERFKRSLESLRQRRAVSLDGHEISLQANAERRDELLQSVTAGADGIGLYRTEFLYLQGAPPDEETQLSEYLSALELLDGKPLIIRTLDLGADKSTDALDFSQLRRSANPALGLRAIRLCLRDTGLFKTQLRAVLRASASGRVRCLIPMITSVQEIKLVKELLGEARAQLDERGQQYDPELPLGGMIEVPAAALAIDELARELDFISVGTNDLLQYALAADRGDEQVAHLYDLQHPGIVRLLRYILREAGQFGIPATICGEAAGDTRYTRLLLALGLRQFSMHPARLLEVKQIIRETRIDRATEAAKRWLQDPSAAKESSLLELLDQSQESSGS
ncbi:MAG: phosphoenolpyruvate--protein phosphotransferase [Xanthomonadales bacterium]|nr:phosphoenolpyruvate--protein phosphotransferase [Gammaproteobacteria bacterium]MBT8053067.1 phosphoenolpyruvate--protein phosphotransferase [Gammaproteobacteria bacterium]NND56689.1 phosphoenolpyruvate--protein phosphotransferase [Xanthomonadales bacterium]NNK52674.1 phosphoenolpyruvate--protein phosphotransferase [Xanthomonadales bacterium]